MSPYSNSPHSSPSLSSTLLHHYHSYHPLGLNPLQVPHSLLCCSHHFVIFFHKAYLQFQSVLLYLQTIINHCSDKAQFWISRKKLSIMGSFHKWWPWESDTHVSLLGWILVEILLISNLNSYRWNAWVEMLLWLCPMDL